MGRLVSTAFCVAMLAASAGAFALTEGAKLEKSPIFATHVTKIFSPDGVIPQASIDFELRKREHVTAWVEAHGVRVATIVPGRTYPAGPVHLAFDGVNERGHTLPDGTYVPVIHLGRSHRTITLPSPIELDSRAPVVHVRHRQHAVISPDGDGHKDSFRVVYRLSKPAHGILLVDGKRVEFTRRQPREGVLVWNGMIDGRTAKPGNHVLYISAQDAAGNRARPFPFAIVQIRYVSLGRDRVSVAPGRRFAISLSTDAPTVSWRFAGRHGIARRGTLHFRAPRRAGVYRLYVTVGDHSARALVVVG